MSLELPVGLIFRHGLLWSHRTRPPGGPACRASRRCGAGWRPVLETGASAVRGSSSRCSTSVGEGRMRRMERSEPIRDCTISPHAKSEMHHRGIDESTVRQVLNHPGQRETVRPGGIGGHVPYFVGFLPAFRSRSVRPMMASSESLGERVVRPLVSNPEGESRARSCHPALACSLSGQRAIGLSGTGVAHLPRLRDAQRLDALDVGPNDLRRVVVRDLDIVGIAVDESEADAPLVSDSDCVLPGSVSPELVESIPRRVPEVMQVSRQVDVFELPPRPTCDLRWEPPRPAGHEQLLRLPICKRLDHRRIVTRHVTLVNLSIPESPGNGCMGSCIATVPAAGPATGPGRHRLLRSARRPLMDEGSTPILSSCILLLAEVDRR